MTNPTTQSKQGTPTICHVCSRHAIGVGIGENNTDPRFLCGECVAILEQIKRVRRFDPYEKQALEGAVNAVGEFIMQNGAKTELADFDETEQLMLCRAAVQGFGDELRRVIERGEAPF